MGKLDVKPLAIRSTIRYKYYCVFCSARKIVGTTPNQTGLLEGKAPNDVLQKKYLIFDSSTQFSLALNGVCSRTVVSPLPLLQPRLTAVGFFLVRIFSLPFFLACVSCCFSLIFVDIHSYTIVFTSVHLCVILALSYRFIK